MVGQAVGATGESPKKMTGKMKVSQNYLTCQNRNTMPCRGGSQTRPWSGNRKQGRFQTCPYSGWTLPARNAVRCASVPGWMFVARTPR